VHWGAPLIFATPCNAKFRLRFYREATYRF
jgi:hypothetical protein